MICINLGKAWCFFRGQHRWNANRESYEDWCCITCGATQPVNLGEWGRLASDEKRRP